VLRRLLKAAISVEFTINKLDLEVYKQCYLINSKQQISRILRKYSNILFYIISWDIIYIRNGIGGEKYILYIIDDYTKLYFVFTLLNNKLNSLLKYLKGVTAYVLRQYNLVI
jgi:hypothetical protein